MNELTRSTVRNEELQQYNSVIQAQVEARLNSSDYKAIRAISCVFDNGVLTLIGRVPTYFQKQLAHSLAHSCPGVDKLQSELDVGELEVELRPEPPRMTQQTSSELTVDSLRFGIRAVITDFAPEEEVVEELVNLYRSLNALHIACGGSGFVIDDWQIFVREYEPAKVM